jgi:hypothetical protein
MRTFLFLLLLLCNTNFKCIYESNDLDIQISNYNYNSNTKILNIVTSFYVPNFYYFGCLLISSETGSNNINQNETNLFFCGTENIYDDNFKFNLKFYTINFNNQDFNLRRNILNRNNNIQILKDNLNFLNESEILLNNNNTIFLFENFKKQESILSYRIFKTGTMKDIMYLSINLNETDFNFKNKSSIIISSFLKRKGEIDSNNNKIEILISNFILILKDYYYDSNRCLLGTIIEIQISNFYAIYLFIFIFNFFNIISIKYFIFNYSINYFIF